MQNKIQVFNYIQSLLWINDIRNTQLKNANDTQNCKIWLYDKQHDGVVILSLQIYEQKLIIYNKINKDKFIFNIKSLYNLRQTKQQLLSYVKKFI